MSLRSSKKRKRSPTGSGEKGKGDPEDREIRPSSAPAYRIRSQDETRRDRESAISAENKSILRRVAESADAYPPLKIVAEYLSFILNSCERTKVNERAIESLAPHVERFSEILCEYNFPTRDVGEIGKRDKLGRKLEEIGQAMNSITYREDFTDFLSNPEIAQKLNGLVEDIRHAFVVYLARIPKRLAPVVPNISLRLRSNDGSLSIVDPDCVLLNGLHHASDAGYLSGNRRGRPRGTRVDVLIHLERWLEDEQGARVFWLNGLAGTGKSAVAQTVAEISFMRGDLGASFFCSRDFEDRSNLHTIFPTLAFQLADRFSAFRECLLRVLETNPDIRHESLLSQMEKAIVGSLKVPHIQTLIIIDALDECKDNEPTSAFLSVLSRYVEEIPQVKFFITSRPEPRIHAGFQLEPLRSITEVFKLGDVERPSVDSDIESASLPSTSGVICGIERTPSTRNTLSSPLDENHSTGEHAPHLARAGLHDTVTTYTSESACGRLIRHTFTPREFPSLIDVITSSKDEGDVIRCLLGDDAQNFINVIDEALDGPDLSPRTQKRCLKLLYRTCGLHALLPGILKIHDHYDRTKAVLYRGGFADVWKGEHHGRTVAVKVIRTYSNNDLQRMIGRFCKEVVTWKFLRHPNVLPLIGVMVSENQFAMISDWMANGNINDFMKAHPDANRLELLGDVTRGLIYVHSQGMIHGDLKGANILIDQTGHACLADFGLLTIISDPKNLLSSSSYLQGGTSRWMSPELINPQHSKFDNGRRTVCSDCYALGMVIYEIISGRVPFHQYADLIVFVKVLAGERPSRGVGFAESLWKMLEMCWALEPNDRPSVDGVLQRLEDISKFSEPLSPGTDEEIDYDHGSSTGFSSSSSSSGYQSLPPGADSVRT